MKKYLLLLIFQCCYEFSSAAPTVTDNHIKVDQFGYQCNARKVAVISNPITGYNNGSSFTPGTTTYEIRKWSDDAIVFSGSITQWNGGATHSQSGDQVWWFDFSAFTTSGSYYVYDNVRNVGSYRFDIKDDVYKDVLKLAIRSYYYQRCGVAKNGVNAGAGWADASCHIGTSQDLDCRLYNDVGNASLSRDLSGGWHDAGDYNKYVNFTWGILLNLLIAYEESPSVWTDDYNIPESGNGVPDLLDEVKYELDWLLKMQEPNGSVLSIVGGGGASPPSSDSQARRYGPANTSSTLTCAGVFALAAIQYNSVGMTAYATTLQNAAVNAWNWANANPNVTWSNSGLVGAGEQEIDAKGRALRKLAASVFLYARTGNAAYKTYFENNYEVDPGGGYWYLWGYAYPFDWDLQDAMLYYSKLPGATASVVNNIVTRYTNSLSNGNTDNLPAYTGNTDAYRAFVNDNNYTWGSNATKCIQGNMFNNMLAYNLDAGNSANYKNAASGFIHYIHGVNPTAFCYLSNMSSAGGENSVNEFFHSWFSDGSALWDRVGTSTYGPAPGFLVGGPNRYYNRDGCCPSGCGSAAANAQCNTALITPPLSQPYQKAYKDWNASWPQNSWEITENSTGYQAAYIKLVSKFISGSCSALPVTFTWFAATLDESNQAILRWQTSSEINNDYFIVEKSRDGIVFESLAKINPQSDLNYFYTDPFPFLGIASYYRIKQVDKNGQSSTTEIRQVRMHHDHHFILFPNPVSRNLVIASNYQSVEPLNISMTDLSGKEVLKSEVYFKDQEPIDLSNIPAGMYFITIKTSDQIETQMILRE